jgi:hypothetical protein
MALVRSDARTTSRQIRKTTRRPETPKGKRRPGRPSKYKPEFAERVTDYCLLGATNQELAGIFKVRDTTIPEWIDRYPEFAEAIKKGREIADANVAKALYRRAIGWIQPAVKIVADAKTGAEHVVHYEEHFPPDTAAAFIWLKNRQPHRWRDKKEVHETGDHASRQPVVFELSPAAKAHVDEVRRLLGPDHTQPSAPAEGSPAGNEANGARTSNGATTH